MLLVNTIVLVKASYTFLATSLIIEDYLLILEYNAELSIGDS